ncbi:MAG: energy-dependent translational throttle protein EttA [Rickettsiaceae bacterium]|nr:energy-dependent translational throttle protein EttA [Rickettsiaceae bacterium]
MSNQYIYVIKGLTKHINGKQILKETWLSFLPNAKIGIIGHNGAGKSTLLRIMAGIDKEFDGEAWAANNVKVGFLEQEPKLDFSKDVFGNIVEALSEKKELLDRFYALSEKFAEELSDAEMDSLIQEQAALQEKIEALDAWNLDQEINMATTALHCPPSDAKIEDLSGGERRRVALCKLLLEKPDLLLLDEPTNHLDADSIAWLENHLKHYQGSVVIITHDRYFLDNIAEWILEIERGNCIPWHAKYSDWLDEKQKKLAQENKEDKDRQKELEKELEWIRQSPKARQAKNKARINSYNELYNEAQEKRQMITAPQIIIPNGPRLGSSVIEITNISKKFGDKELLANFSCIVPAGSIVGVVGPNGAGKSTLFNMLTGKDNPDSGEIKIGSTVKMGYVDQMRDALDSNKTVWQEISDELEELQLGNKTIKSRAYCAAFNFKGGDQQKKVGQLSGGERNRVHMAKLLRQGANVILLDEPSNDLDVDTLRALEDALLNFAGCALVISHDRWFLDRIATHIISFDNGNATMFDGNYADYYNYVTTVLKEDLSNSKARYRKFS